jgi:DNA-binding MarR family transcriptional regulator
MNENQSEQFNRLINGHNLICDLRKLIAVKLPVQNSLLPLDILLVVLDTKNSNCLTVKKLFASLPHSQTAFRYNFSRLLKDDWIALSRVETDKRTRIVVPTIKLLSRFEELINELRI